MDGEVCFDFIAWKYGRERDIRLEKTSDDPDLRRYYDHMGSLGSCFMDCDGNIRVTIHDAGGATMATWYEEVMHAKQFLDRGQFSVGIGGTVPECEVEVASCLLRHAKKLALADGEIVLIQKSLDFYNERTNDG